MMIKTVIYQSEQWFNLVEQGWITRTIEDHPYLGLKVAHMVHPDVRGTKISYD